jgi:hypothetical protein
MTVSKNWLRTSIWKQILDKYISPELDPDPDLMVKISDLDPAKRSGSDQITYIYVTCTPVQI